MPAPRGPTARTCLSFRSDQLAALRVLSEETGAPIAELARRAVDAFLAGRVAGYVPAIVRNGKEAERCPGKPPSG